MTDLLFRGRRVTLDSPLSHDEVTRRLQQAIAPAAWRFNDRRTEPFEGTFENGRFRVMRLVKGRNSFRPLIDGEVSPGQPGARVDVTMRLHPLVIGLLAILGGIGLLVATVAVYGSISTRSLEPQLVVLPVIGIAALVVAGTSSLEVKRALRMLSELLDVRAGSA